MAGNPEYLTIQKLFSSDSYVIPIYQRNYAWTEKEITQLIQDIADFAEEKASSNYHIGTLVVYKRKASADKEIYETIDGQQRLTTLYILFSILKCWSGTSFQMNWFTSNLHFDSRPKSNDTLEKLYSKPSDLEDLQNYDNNIKQGFYDAEKALRKILKENSLNQDIFCNYLFNQVFILRVEVPEETDLNHYFEIMNSRGEQLEKHEILKARCLNIIKEDEKATYAFNLIWEACANMEKYVHYGFKKRQRDNIFGEKDWDKFIFQEFDSLATAIIPENDGLINPDTPSKMIDLLISPARNPGIIPKENQDEKPDRFNSVINFSNFLMHVLRIHTKGGLRSEGNPLDDKKLIDAFDSYLKGMHGEPVDFVKNFAYNLLKCRFLFDKYIIKREYTNNKDGWSLKRLKWDDDKQVKYVITFSSQKKDNGEADEVDKTDNKVLLMLQAMFHVSFPTQSYKYWLNASLKYVFEQSEVSVRYFIGHLEKLARVLLFDRFLAESPHDYHDIIYGDIEQRNDTDTNWALLHKGTGVENFTFNYLDYLLWKRGESDKTKKIEKADKFDFTFRSSVEHYYPQNPLGQIERLPKELLDNFGNLCLVSASRNSKLSNRLPDEKRKYYIDSDLVDSLKQQIMMNYNIWGPDQIKEHAAEMIELLKSGTAKACRQ